MAKRERLLFSARFVHAFWESNSGLLYDVEKLMQILKLVRKEYMFGSKWQLSTTEPSPGALDLTFIDRNVYVNNNSMRTKNIK